MTLLTERLEKAFALTDALAASLDAAGLAAHNGKARSNTIGAQFWCVCGARESYARAYEAGAWKGFACSLKDAGAPEAVTAALAASRGKVSESVAAAAADAAREAILFDLLEHEAQHQGQLIRYFYANDLPFPPEFAKRYALD